MEAEVALSGGRITPGVVRVGDTVRRPASAASGFVADLLRHLERQGFDGAPRHLGRDQQGRDILSYLPSHVPERFRTWTDGQVAAAGTLLRALHDATRGSSLAAPQPLVCHGDPGPNNCVFREGRPVAFIDYDQAAPGEALTDVGYLAWTWCISSRPTAPPAHAQAAQVRLLADAYGLTAPERRLLPDAVLDSQLRNARWWQDRRDATGPTPATSAQIAERVAWSHREHAHTHTHRAAFDEALRAS
ncbi:MULTISPECIES: phosphotransferase [Streptacidiphilus]|uniref:Phosphotransferase n=1 Tax=Streptacidiphilus cavernicola TaxID=3342716 RepID=A0ABV6UKU4_9ACTN|nr:phosphotransferase [Streptacidiphilus jeojiense]